MENVTGMLSDCSMSAMSEKCRLLREGQLHFQWFNCRVWLEACTDTQVLENVSSLQCALGQANFMLSDEVQHRWVMMDKRQQNLGQEKGSGEQKSEPRLGLLFLF